MCGKWADPLNTENSFLLKFSFLIIRYGKRNKCDFTLILFSYVFPFSPFRSQSYIFALFTMCPPVLSPVCFSFCCMYFFFSHELHSYHLIVLFFLIQTAKGLTNDILIYLNFTRWKLNLWRKMKTRWKTKWGHKMELLFLIIIVFFRLFFKE